MLITFRLDMLFILRCVGNRLIGGFRLTAITHLVLLKLRRPNPNKLNFNLYKVESSKINRIH